MTIVGAQGVQCSQCDWIVQWVNNSLWNQGVFVGQTFDGATPLRCFCPNVDAWSAYMAFYTAGWGPLANDTSK